MVFPIEMMGNNGIFKTMKINTNVSFSLRNLEDKTSSQYLQILFSFSIPNEESLEKIQNLEKPIISAGAVRMMVNALCHMSQCNLLCSTSDFSSENLRFQCGSVVCLIVVSCSPRARGTGNFC